MNTKNKARDHAALPTPEREPTGHHTHCGKSPGQLLKKRVIIYDCEEETLEVRSQKDVAKSKLSPYHQYFTNNSNRTRSARLPKDTTSVAEERGYSFP